ncbi:unnamed protein product [Lota lota]
MGVTEEEKKTKPWVRRRKLKQKKRQNRNKDRILFITLIVLSIVLLKLFPVKLHVHVFQCLQSSLHRPPPPPPTEHIVEEEDGKGRVGFTHRDNVTGPKHHFAV